MVDVGTQEEGVRETSKVTEPSGGVRTSPALELQLYR